MNNENKKQNSEPNITPEQTRLMSEVMNQFKVKAEGHSVYDMPLQIERSDNYLEFTGGFVIPSDDPMSIDVCFDVRLPLSVILSIAPLFEGIKNCHVGRLPVYCGDNGSVVGMIAFTIYGQELQELFAETNEDADEGEFVYEN